MNDQTSPDGKDGAEPSVEPQPPAGQRVDQFLSAAQRLGNVLREKARETAQVAAPKLKDLGQSASAAASRVLDERVRTGSPLGRVRQYFGAGGNHRKVIFLGGGVLGFGALLLVGLLMSLLAPHFDSGPGPTQANFEKVQTGMNEAQVDQLLGMASSSAMQSDGSLAKIWNSQYRNDDPIRVTFVEGKATAKLMSAEVSAPPAPAVAVAATPNLKAASDAAPAASPTTSPPSADQGEVVATDVPDSFWNSAKHAAELHARAAAERMQATMDGSDATFYDVEKTQGADGQDLPNEYVAVIYVKSPTNAFGTHQNITFNLFYKYKPDTKELLLVDTRHIDRGFSK